MKIKPIEILLVEDNPADVRLTVEALKEGKVANTLNVAKDGVEALDYLYKRNGFEDKGTPDLILLDLNMPKMDGREVLAVIKVDDNLKSIPVVVLTTSTSEIDVAKAYNEHANCYIAKPVDLESLVSIVKAIENFWLSIVSLPPKGG